MKQNLILIFLLFTIIALSLQLVSAQFPLKIPKLPKTEKPKQEQPNDNGSSQFEVAKVNKPFYWHNFRLDNNGTFRRENYPDAFYLDKNPGEYTVKIYRNGAQIRELSFSVGADGKIVVPAYSTQISLPHNRVIVPVKILGTEKWDSISWKTDAFFGNPLAGFNLP